VFVPDNWQKCARQNESARRATKQFKTFGQNLMNRPLFDSIANNKLLLEWTFGASTRYEARPSRTTNAMTESKDPNQDLPQKGTLEALHLQHAIWTTKRFRFLYPDLSAALYESDGWFIVHVSALSQLNFPELQKVFDYEIRPAGSPIRLSETAPLAGVPVEEETGYGAELWLNGVPLPVPLVNKLLGVAVPNVPEGSFDYAREEDTWLFRSPKDLLEAERASVAAATTKLGYLGPIRFVTVPEASSAREGTLKYRSTEETLDLVTAREIKLSTSSLRHLVERDEEEWRKFLDTRANQEIASPPPNGQEFACLYDVGDNSEIRLSELLTLYDRVDLLPSLHDLAWLEKHRVSLDDLQELVRMKRVRLVLPHSADKYPERLLSAISEADSSSLVLSRTLASKTILHGQYKEPILYAPLTAKQRWSVLAALSRVATDKMSRVLLASYSRLFQAQHDVFMTRGALASAGFGVGSYLGELFYQLRRQDARLELMTCGAAIEWALGLGASFIPRDFGLYDETANSMVVASYLGRTRVPQVDPTAERMHVVVDGLLAVSDVPPMEVARNFRSLPANRFRNLASKLMRATPRTVELQSAVEEINADVAAFERRAERLARWKVKALIEATAAGAMHEHVGFWASIAAEWLFRILKEKLPASVQRELEDTAQMLVGFATGTCLDAVIVSRSRKAIGEK
jgi:hypothetical protein